MAHDPGTLRARALNTEADRLARLRTDYDEASRALGQAYALAHNIDTPESWKTVDARLAEFTVAETAYIGPPPPGHDDWSADARATYLRGMVGDLVSPARASKRGRP